MTVVVASVVSTGTRHEIATYAPGNVSYSELNVEGGVYDLEPVDPIDLPSRRLADSETRDYVSNLWADDWDSPEDSIYDA